MNNLTFINYLFNCILVAVLLILVTFNNYNYAVSAVAVNPVAHYHHNKRQQQQQLTPTLTLEIEPHPGFQPTVSDPQLEYYFPEHSGSFYFTCTVKHPSLRYKMRITREQFYSSDKQVPIDILDTGEYKLSPSLNDERMSINMTEVYEGNTRSLRVSFIIKNLNLQDNGIYRCLYSSNKKAVNVTVFKSVTPKDIVFPYSGKIERVNLNEMASIGCKVNDIYPKPSISFSHSGGESLTGLFSEIDKTNINHERYYYYSILGTLNYTAKYTDNGKHLNCTAVSTNGQTFVNATKSLTLNVIGTQIIHEECLNVTAKEGDKAVQLTCVFFSNPVLTPEWETKLEPSIKTTTISVTQTQPPQSNDESTEPTKSETVSEETPTIAEETILKITNDDPDSNYNVSVEEQGAANSYVYKTVLTIKDVKLSDFKSYTLRLSNDLVKTIVLENILGAKRDNQMNNDHQQSSSSSINALIKTQYHSKVFIALIINLLTTSFIMKLNR